jgi:hypothetical protein
MDDRQQEYGIEAALGAFEERRSFSVPPACCHIDPTTAGS